MKSLETFDFLAIPSLNKKLVLEPARCEWITRRENVLALDNSGTGKTHMALALGLAACQREMRVRFTTAAALVHELIEARDEKRLLRFQEQLQRQELLIVDELGFVPLSKTGEVLGSKRLTGALLDRLTHHVHILEMNGDSYRLKDSKRKRAAERAKWADRPPGTRMRFGAGLRSAPVVTFYSALDSAGGSGS